MGRKSCKPAFKLLDFISCRLECFRLKGITLFDDSVLCRDANSDIAKGGAGFE